MMNLVCFYFDKNVRYTSNVKIIIFCHPAFSPELVFDSSILKRDEAYKVLILFVRVDDQGLEIYNKAH